MKYEVVCIDKPRVMKNNNHPFYKWDGDLLSSISIDNELRELSNDGRFTILQRDFIHTRNNCRICWCIEMFAEGS